MKTSLLALVLLVAAGCRCAQPQPVVADPTPSPVATPPTPEACKACNGEWGIHGLAQKEGCLCRTKDAGKVCKSNRDCESQCVAKETPDTEIVDQGPPAKGFFLGQCHAFTTFFGCARLLRAGEVGTAPVSLAELPPKLCID